MAFLRRSTNKEEKTEAREARDVSREDRRNDSSSNVGILLHSHITEKTAMMRSQRTYGFVVASKANKPEVKKAVEKRYNVHVIDVRVVTIPGKELRRGKQIGWKQGMKKAMVTLKQGETIEIQ